MAKPAKKISEYLVFYFYLAFESLLRLLTLEDVFRFGALLGRTASYFLIPYFRLVEDNLHIAFPSKSPTWRKKIARDCFANNGANILCALRLPFESPVALANRITLQNKKYANELLAEQKKGAFIALLAHKSCWEIFAHIIEARCGREIGALYQKLGNRPLNKRMTELRRQRGLKLFDRSQGFFPPLNFLREGGVLGILCDQHAGDRGVWAPFFGRLASTTNLPWLLAQKSRVPNIMVDLRTIGVARWEISFRKLVFKASENKSPNLALAQYNQALSDCVRNDPADYFWMHRRWKTPKPNFLLGSYKRPLVLPSNVQVSNLRPFVIAVRIPNWLGDICMAARALRAIADKNSGRADSRVIVVGREHYAELLEALGIGDCFFGIKKGENPLSVGRRLLAFVAKKYGTDAFLDAGIVLPNSPRSALELYFAKPKRLVGYRRPWRAWFFDDFIKEKKILGKKREHHSDHYEHLARRLGANFTKLTSPMAKPRSVSGKLRIGICAGAEYGSAKRWPVRRFAETMENFQNLHPQTTWVFIGVAKEREIYRRLREGLQPQIQKQVIDLVGRTTLGDLIVELQKQSLLLSNDTGAMHLAASLGTPTLGIFGSTDPDWTRPLANNANVIYRKVDCSPCFLRECPIDFRCMKAIDPATVCSQMQKVLANRV